MGNCEFAIENILNVQNFQLVLDVDQCGAESHRFCEIPVSGPGKANRLAIITGIAVPALDTSDPDVSYKGDIYIKTDYIVNSPDRWLNIVNGNTSLLQATTATLANIFDESEGPSLFAVDEVAAQRNTDGRIQINLRVAIQGDVTLSRIAYQANVLIFKVD